MPLNLNENFNNIITKFNPEYFKTIQKNNKQLNSYITLPIIGKNYNCATLKEYGEILITYYAARIKEGQFMFNQQIYKLDSAIWDFSSCNKIKDKSGNYKVLFNMENKEDALLLKLYLMYELNKAGKYYLKFPNKINILKKYLKFLQNNKVNVLTVSDELFKEYYSDILISRNRYIIKEFYLFFENLFNKKRLTNELIELLDKKEPRNIEANKTPLIPTKLYEDLTKQLKKDLVANKINNPFILASYMQILTGLRISEVIRLKSDCLKDVKGTDKGKLLSYYNTKSASNPIERLLPITPDIINLVKYCNSLFKDEYLFGTALDVTNTHKAYKQYLYDNAKTLHLDKKYDGTKETIINDKTIYIPTFTSFRVYQITKKRELGISPRLIALMYGHISVAMEDYYARDIHQDSSDTNHLRLIAQTLFKGERPLGPKAEIRQEQFNQELLKRNVVDDVESYMEVLDETYTIKRKRIGYCMLSKNRECKNDQLTDEYDCAFGKCSNTIHFFFILPESIKEADKLLFTYKRAKENGQDIIALKETQKLKRIVQQYVEPEYKELLKEVKTRSKEDVIKEFTILKELLEEPDKLSKKIEEYKNVINERNNENE